MSIQNDVDRLFPGMREEKEAALAKGVCVECGEPAIPKCYSEAGRKEYFLSGLCEECFDRLFGEDEEE